MFEAERAWAYGQELMKEAIDEEDNVVRRKAIARLRRALSWADQLTTLTTELFTAGRISSQDQAEALAYRLVMYC